MPAHFKLNYSGLNYLISSSEACQNRNFILQLLRHNIYSSASMSELASVCDMDKKQITKTVYQMLKQGWLSSIDETEGEQPAIMKTIIKNGFTAHLSKLSSTGSVMLVGMNGLVISTTGFSGIQTSYLAASATSLILINETAQKRNIELCNDSPWSLGLKWGKLEVMAQLICVGSVKFILVIGGYPVLDNNAFFQLIAMLSRRYSVEQ